MEQITDKEISERVSHIKVNPFEFKNLTFRVDVLGSFRGHLFYRLLNGWNDARVKAGYKKISKQRLASAIAVNPFLKKDDGELELLIKECEEKKNYKRAQWILFPKNK